MNNEERSKKADAIIKRGEEIDKKMSKDQLKTLIKLSAPELMKRDDTLGNVIAFVIKLAILEDDGMIKVLI